MRIGLEYGNDPAGNPRIPPATFAGISRSVKIASVRWQDCEPIAWPAWWRGEITIGDAFPGEPVCPSPQQGFPGSVDLMVRLLRGEAGGYRDLEEIQQEVTRFKIDEARRAGCSAINFGPLYDWPLPNPYPWQGLTRPDGTPRPVCDVVRAAQ